MVRLLLSFPPLLWLAQSTALPPVQIPTDGDRQAIMQALEWVRSPQQVEAEYEYVMTARVRFLLFWVSRDDVGGGTIRRGRVKNDSSLESLQLLIGSDPAKAPLRINRWGAATEINRRPLGTETPAAAAFFGFMKETRGETMSEMRGELAAERVSGRYSYRGILCRLDHGRSIWVAAPYFTDRDYSVRDFDMADNQAIDQITNSERPLRVHPTTESCPRPAGFLSSVLALIDATLDGQRPPLERCYAIGKRSYILRLTDLTPEPKRTIQVKLRAAPGRLERTYHDLFEARFVIMNLSSGAHYPFSLAYGRSGALRGVPVQIGYQPNWWFKLVLSLKSTKPLNLGPSAGH